MEITVILPVYNKIKYIEKSVASILAQTFSDFELITVDDGSTDGSGELLDEIAASDTRVKVIHKQNGGVSAARNTALDAGNISFLPTETIPSVPIGWKRFFRKSGYQKPISLSADLQKLTKREIFSVPYVLPITI